MDGFESIVLLLSLWFKIKVSVHRYVWSKGTSSFITSLTLSVSLSFSSPYFSLLHTHTRTHTHTHTHTQTHTHTARRRPLFHPPLHCNDSLIKKGEREKERERKGGNTHFRIFEGRGKKGHEGGGE